MILIVGGLGFVGKNVAMALLDAGEDCVLTWHKNDQVPEPLKSQLGKRIFIEQLDVVDTKAFLALGKKYQITGIVNLLTGGFTLPSASALEFLKDMNDTLTSVANSLQAGREWGVKRVSVASAPAIYNGIAELPWREDAPLPLKADFSIEAFKKCAEIMALYLGTQTHVDTVMLRLPAMYGPFYDPTRGSLVGRLVHAAAKGEKPNLEGMFGSAFAEDGMDQCYIRDAARGIALLHTTDKLSHQVYNVASGRPITNQAIADAVKKAVPGFEVELKPGHMPGFPEDAPYQDITWLHEDTGYEPQFDIDAAVADYLAWLRAGHER